MAAIIIIPSTAYAIAYVNTIQGADSTITCSPSSGTAKCKVNQLSDFFFGGTYFGIDTGNAVAVNPSILWQTNDMPMLAFGGGEDGSILMDWVLSDRTIQFRDVYGNSFAMRHVLKAPNGTCYELQVGNSGSLSASTTPCR